MKLILSLFCLQLSECFLFPRTIHTFRNKIKVKNNKYFTDESFHGVWNLKRSDNKTEIINICPNGKIENPSNLGRIIDGVWYTNKHYLTLITFNFNSQVNEIFYGKINNDNINVEGTISYGSQSPDYICNFEMKPIFPIFHNISLKNTTNDKQNVN